MIPHHGVTEWTTSPPIWVADDEWGVTLTTADGHRVDLDARMIRDLHGALDGLEPLTCVECGNYADPEVGDDQTCREHTPSRRWKG